MGLRKTLRGRCVYLDTNILIYLMEGNAIFAPQMEEIADGILAGDFACVTSELSLCEVLVLPMRIGNTILENKYREFIEQSGAIDLVPTTRETYILAGRCRANLGLKTADAIHVASAVLAGADVFLTNDRPIKVPSALELVNFSTS